MDIDAKTFARVVILSPLKEPLIYRVPEAFRDRVSAGLRVLIPLGKRKVIGILLEFLDVSPLSDTKDILAILDERPILDSALIRLSQWIAQYYLASLGEVFGTILPPSLKGESQLTVIAKPGAFAANDALEQKILELLRQRKGKISARTLSRAIAGGKIYQTLERLEARGAIEIREQLPGQKKRRENLPSNPESISSPHPPPFTLSTEQQRALTAIEDRLQAGGFETFLLHGVTGSGKTEIYLRAMARVRELGRRSLILIPEISLTPQLIDRLSTRFRGRMGILHSALTDAERWAQWWQILRGNADVVIGARSAVFAPLPDIGVIIVDEEHDSSYKQEEGLRYNGRDSAVVRGKLLGCPVVLGSATPSIESYENARQGRYRLLEISQRVQERPLPSIETIDLRAEFTKMERNKVDDGTFPLGATTTTGGGIEHRWIGNRLAKLLQENLQRSRQSLIFLNRRGFSNFLQCRRCGYVVRCSYCSVTLTLHLKHKSVRCHHCNFRRPATEVCPGCGDLTLSGVGVGTEQIENALRDLIPTARIARMDRDTMSRRGSHAELIRRWERGEIDVLVGTQMITKGHDVSGVTLVGALLADLSLNMPDFRAAERTFQLLSQVAGRSGRGNDPGNVIIQTYVPDHYAIQYLVNHDYKGFFAAETAFRRALNYPPFTRLVSLRVDGLKTHMVEKKAKTLASQLREKQANNPRFHEQIELLGPAPAPIAKLRNRYRWQILIKGKQTSSLLEFADQARQLLPSSHNLRLHIDVDPYSML